MATPGPEALLIPASQITESGLAGAVTSTSVRGMRTTTHLTAALTGVLGLTLLTGCGEVDSASTGTTEPAPEVVTNSPADEAGSDGTAAADESDDGEEEPSGGPDDSGEAGETVGDEATGGSAEETSEEATGPVAAPPPVARPSGSGCTPEGAQLPDGRWYGGVAAADDALTFNLKCWFEGVDADLAVAEDGGPPGPADDGYHVRDDNPELRTIPVRDGTTVVHYPSGWPDDDVTLPYAEWVQVVEDDRLLFDVWIVVEEGQVTSVEEKWVP